MARKKPNGVFVEVNGKGSPQEEATLYGVFHRLVGEILYPDPNGGYRSTPVFHRIKGSLSESAPLLREASRNTGRHVLVWTRRGSPLRALLVVSMSNMLKPLRALLVVSVGTIALLTLTGLLVFMLFLLAATANAIVISLLMSLAAAGGFLAIFFACVVAIYIGAISVAVFVISTTNLLLVVPLAYLTIKKHLVVCCHVHCWVVNVVHLLLLDAILATLFEVHCENRRLIHQDGTTKTYKHTMLSFPNIQCYP